MATKKTTETIETTEISETTEIEITSNAKIVCIDGVFYEVVDGKIQIKK